MTGMFGKLLTVFAFALLLYFLIDYIIGRLNTYIATNDLPVNIMYFLCKMGILEAINIFFSLLIASWFVNKIIGYLST